MNAGPQYRFIFVSSDEALSPKVRKTPGDVGGPAMIRSPGIFHGIFRCYMRSVLEPQNPEGRKADLIRHLCWLPWGTLQKRSILVARVRAMIRQGGSPAKKRSHEKMVGEFFAPKNHRVGSTPKKKTPLFDNLIQAYMN